MEWLSLELERIWLHAEAAYHRQHILSTHDILLARASSPIAWLPRLEAETLLLAIAPHLDPPLADLFAALRGARRPVDLALVIQLHGFDRAQLLSILDPSNPLLSHDLIELGPIAHTSTTLHPTFHALALVCDTPTRLPTHVD